MWVNDAPPAECEDEWYIHKIEFKSTGMVFLTFSVLSLESWSVRFPAKGFLSHRLL